MALQFEGDDEKEQSNVEKHGVDFETAERWMQRCVRCFLRMAPK